MISCLAFDSDRCKSCDFIKLTYEEGLNLKIEKIAKFFNASLIQKSIKSEVIEGYRNKGKFIVGGDLDNPIVGIPSPFNKNQISQLTDCPLHSSQINQIAILIRDSISEYRLTPYDMESKTGELKYIIISEGYKTEELSIRLGMRSLESFDRVKKLYSFLTSVNSNIKVFAFDVQAKHAAVFEGEEKLISESRYIHHRFGAVELASSTSNFFQVNSHVAEQLYQKVFDRFCTEDIGSSVDLFCGVGGFAQQISRFSKNVYGIEINSVAIACAKYSASKNNISNISFICDDANNFQNHISEAVDLLVVNPPRRGIGKDLCHLINKINPKFLVYSSCNATSLAADIEILSIQYKVESITPVDMFPLTGHLEVLCFLVRS